MKILYGTSETNVDITEYCLKNLNNENIITIPAGDVERAAIFRIRYMEL